MTSLIKRLRFGQKGFTLIELLVVVAIIALLATFAVPKLFEAINKSKKAPGQADMQTISAALDRYYFDHDEYPFFADNASNANAAAGVKSELTDGYLKASLTFRNGYKQGYLYGTTVNGKGFVLVDLQGNLEASNTVTVTCDLPDDNDPVTTDKTTATWTVAEGDDVTMVVPTDNNGAVLLPDTTKFNTCAITATSNTNVTVADLIKNTSMMTN